MVFCGIWTNLCYLPISEGITQIIQAAPRLLTAGNLFLLHLVYVFGIERSKSMCQSTHCHVLDSFKFIIQFLFFIPFLFKSIASRTRSCPIDTMY